MTAPASVLLDGPTAAEYAGVKPATLRVWAHRYGLTQHYRGRAALYDLGELAQVLARRAGEH